MRVVPFDHPDAVRLVAEVQLVFAERYGEGDTTPVEPAEFAPPAGAFVVGYAGGRAVSCGGWRSRDADPEAGRALRDGDAEIKRMYVVPAARGRGHARAVLAELERTARLAGRGRMVLETGFRQPEAITLYRSAGYAPMPPFGIHREHPGCRCFSRPLSVATVTAGGG